MTKASAFNAWLSDFAPAFAEGGVPQGVASPYFTYDWAEGSFVDGEVSVLVNLWVKTESEAVPNAIVSELSHALGLGGVMLHCDGGAIWVKRDTPFAQAVSSDGPFKRRYINLSIESMTDY